jgi:hypothetical protein
VDLLRALLNLQVELPFFPLLLIAIGIIWLIRGVTQRQGHTHNAQPRNDS